MVEQWWNPGPVTCHMSCHLADSPWKEMEETLHTKVKLGHMWINDDLDDIKCPAQGIHIETASSKQFTWPDVSFRNSRCTYKITLMNIM